MRAEGWASVRGPARGGDDSRLHFSPGPRRGGDRAPPAGRAPGGQSSQPDAARIGEGNDPSGNGGLAGLPARRGVNQGFITGGTRSADSRLNTLLRTNHWTMPAMLDGTTQRKITMGKMRLKLQCRKKSRASGSREFPPWA